MKPPRYNKHKKKESLVDRITIVYNSDGTFTLAAQEKSTGEPVNIARLGLISGYSRIKGHKKIFMFERDYAIKSALWRFSYILYRPMMGDDPEKFIVSLSRFFLHIPKGGMLKVFFMDNKKGELLQTTWYVKPTKFGLMVARPACFKGGRLWRQPNEKYIDFARRVFDDIVKNVNIRSNDDQYSIMLKEAYFKWDFSHIPFLRRRVKVDRRKQKKKEPE